MMPKKTAQKGSKSKRLGVERYLEAEMRRFCEVAAAPKPLSTFSYLLFVRCALRLYLRI
jgi:hypothetical protein